MMRKSFCALVLLSVIVFAGDVLAEIKADYGAGFRLRQEYWENVTDLETRGQPDRDFFRLRSSLWGKIDLNESFGAYLKLTNEAKYYLGSYRPFLTSDSTSDDTRFDVDELVIDNLYVSAKNIFGLPIDLRIGRQDFLGEYGEGFLILDGTPGDGSRTAYFNAAKASWKISKSHSVDVLYISNTNKEEYLPSLYPSRSDSLSGYVDNKKLLNASDETGVVVYGKSQLNDNIRVEPYYMFKEEDPVGTNSTLKLNTVGARMVFTAANWKVRGEYAHQFGEYESHRDRKGNGGYILAGQKFDDVPLKPEWELGYVYLSGDDPSTSDHEGWNPLFSRAPMWNELLVYLLLPETIKDSGPIPAYWTNLHLFKAGVKLALTPDTLLDLQYQYLRADEATSGLNSAMFTNGGKERGHLGVFVLSHNFTKRLSGFLQVEYFVPGDFYGDNAKDAILARWQLQYRF